MADYADNLDRSNDASLGSPWVETDSSSGSSQQIVTNRVQVLSAVSAGAVHGSLSIYNDTFTDDQYSRVTFESILNAGVAGPGVRLTGTYNAVDGYIALYNGTDIRLYLVDGFNLFDGVTGTKTQIGTEYVVALVDTDTFEVQASGTTISLLVNDVEQASGTEVTIPSGGQAGIAGHSASNAATRAVWFSAWAGGDVAGAPPGGGGSAQPVLIATAGGSSFGFGTGT